MVALDALQAKKPVPAKAKLAPKAAPKKKPAKKAAKK